MTAIRLMGIALFCASSSLNALTVGGTIEKNVDGDTVWVAAKNSTWGTPAKGRERLKIRMIGIDAPESHLPTPQGVVGQGDFGDIAAEKMVGLAPVGSKVTVDDKGLDKYGRTLGRLIAKGKDINLKMVEIGWAIPYIICEGPSCNKDYFVSENVQAYIDACFNAEEEGLGIFNPKKPLKEMPFEFRLRMQNRKPDKYVGDWETKELYRPADYEEVETCNRIFFKRILDAKKAGFKPAFRPTSSDEE